MRALSRRPRKQAGIALITVILVVALATVAAVAMAARQQIDIRRTENALHGDQAYQYALAAEQWAGRILIRDRRDGAVDHPGEMWAQRLPPLPVEGGAVEGRIVDEQGLFNVNNLLAPGTFGEVAQERFLRLLLALQIDPELVMALLDWMDPDVEERVQGGAEDNFYLGLEPPYRAANQLLTSPTELRQVKGVTPEVYEKLAPYVTALPTFTPLNVNTAPPALLMTLADGLSLEALKRLEEDRPEDGFPDVNAFLAHQVFVGMTVSDAGLSVGSEYFRVAVTAYVGRFRTTLFSLVHRGEDGRARVLQRSEGVF